MSRSRTSAPLARRRAWARPTAAVLTLLVVGALSVVAAPLASAHDSIVSSVPADKAALTTAPTVVTLTFTDEVNPLGTAVIVTDATGARVDSGTPSIDGIAVTQALDPLTASGRYTVAYRVVSADGHPITGKLSFTVTLPTPTPTPSTPAASATPSLSAGDALTQSAPPTGSTDSAAGAGEPTSSTNPLVWAGVGLVAVVAILGGVAWVRRS
jgi:methionine-rich copper-binding protein CopC